MSSSQEGVGEMQGWGDFHCSMWMWLHEPLSCTSALLRSCGGRGYSMEWLSHGSFVNSSNPKFCGGSPQRALCLPAVL